MDDVIVYLWADVWEMSYNLAPEFWEHESTEASPIHVSLENPTMNPDCGTDFDDESMFGEGKNFILLKRKIYILPTALRRQNDQIYCDDEECEISWNPEKLTVCAKCSQGEFPLVPAD